MRYFYESVRVSTKQKPIVHLYEIKRSESVYHHGKYKITKTEREEFFKKEIKRWASKQWDDISKSSPINNNHLKCKWIKLSIKRHGVAQWIKKQEPNACCLQEIYLSFKNICRLRIKSCNNIVYANGKTNEILETDDFKGEFYEAVKE